MFSVSIAFTWMSRAKKMFSWICLTLELWPLYIWWPLMSRRSVFNYSGGQLSLDQCLDSLVKKKQLSWICHVEAQCFVDAMAIMEHEIPFVIMVEVNSGLPTLWSLVKKKFSWRYDGHLWAGDTFVIMEEVNSGLTTLWFLEKEEEILINMSKLSPLYLWWPFMTRRYRCNSSVCQMSLDHWSLVKKRRLSWRCLMSELSSLYKWWPLMNSRYILQLWWRSSQPWPLLGPPW